MDVEELRLIDWLTLNGQIPEALLPVVREYVQGREVVQRWTPATGEVAWVSPVRESMRSDSHALEVCVGSRIRVSGSPARALGLADNVFGPATLAEAWSAMLDASSALLPFELSGVVWTCSRVDVTHNYLMGSPAEVRQVISYLRESRGGRQVVRGYDSSVYWGQGSRLRVGKVYAKGVHLRHQVRQGKAEIEPALLPLVDRLVRVELQLGSVWWCKQRGGVVDDGLLAEEFKAYWGPKLGGVEVAEVGESEAIIKAALSLGFSAGLGRSAVATWAMVRSLGLDTARECVHPRTWRRHGQILRHAGIGWGDLAAGRIVPFRFRQVKIVEPIESWEHLRRAA